MNRLDEIQERLAAATPGEWYASATVGMTRDEDSRDIESLHEGKCVPIATFPTEGSQPHLDMDLIAHAPADLAALLAFATVVAEYVRSDVRATTAMERIESALNNLEAS